MPFAQVLVLFAFHRIQSYVLPFFSGDVEGLQAMPCRHCYCRPRILRRDGRLGTHGRKHTGTRSTLIIHLAPGIRQPAFEHSRCA